MEEPESKSYKAIHLLLTFYGRKWHCCVSQRCISLLLGTVNAQGSSHGLSLSAHLQKPINYTLTANENLIDQFCFKTQFSSLTGSHTLHMHVGFKHAYSSKYGVFDAVKHADGFNKYSIKSALKFIYWTLWKLRALAANLPQRNRAVQSRSSDARPRARKFN